VDEEDIMPKELKSAKLAIIGLGYVGLPLAVEFAKKFKTIGFDVNQSRIEKLTSGVDLTREVGAEELLQAQVASDAHPGIRFTAVLEELRSCNIYIVTVPTPIDDHNQPDFTPLLRASETVGKVLKQDDIVIYESTVYPGLTEEICVPVLERVSGLAFNTGFTVGYSPERINPGDPHRRLPNIKKVTAGSTPETAEFVDQLYASIITAGTHKASSIRVAEAAKVIENTQRDVNIALINELSMIFKRAGIDTEEVLEAAGTKWNFLPFRPGLVGGHCIGVDPYYLTYKALELGYHPEIILAGRRLNDNMASYIASEVITLMTKQRIQVVDSKVLVMGLTFKENCPDVRNTKVTDIIDELADLNVKVDVYDPWVNVDEVAPPNCRMVTAPAAGEYDAVIVAVAHSAFKELGIDAVRSFGKPKHILYDIKYLFSKNQVDGRL
jgi:UDP-N-acetyl-D-galactosamine dehydrogenase